MENNTQELSVVMDQSLALVITKASIQENAEQLLDRVRSGEMDLLHLIVGIKALAKMEEYIMAKDTALDDSVTVKEAVISYIQDNGEGKQENPKLMVGGIEYEVFEAGVSYDYSKDSVWRDLKEKLIAREARLKSCRVPNAIRDIKPDVDENGIELYPPIRKSTTAFRINFKK